MPLGTTALVIRPLHTDDLPGLAELVRGLLPTVVITEQGLDHMRKSTQWWVAEAGGELVAAARAGRFGRCWLGVAPSARGHGLGHELAGIVEDAVRCAGYSHAVVWTDDAVGACFAERHGYHEERRKPVSVLRVAESDVPELVVPPDVALLPLREIEGRLRELYELTMLAHRDDPADPLDGHQSFEDWLRDDIGVPDLDLDGSVVAVVDGRLASVAYVATDGNDRAENEFTGTHPAFRGRGLATLVKLATVHWARNRGIREIWTGNDSENAPMLAINAKLGYEPSRVRRKHVKHLVG